MSSILNIIEQRRHAITQAEARAGELQKLLDGGLLKITVCDYGTKRSVEGAKIATNKNIPAVFLVGGLSGILDNLGHPGYEKLLSELNKIPEIAVIVWKHELIRYNSILNNLRYAYYETVDHFSDTLPRDNY